MKTKTFEKWEICLRKYVPFFLKQYERDMCDEGVEHDNERSCCCLLHPISFLPVPHRHSFLQKISKIGVGVFSKKVGEWLPDKCFRNWFSVFRKIKSIMMGCLSNLMGAEEETAMTELWSILKMEHHVLCTREAHDSPIRFLLASFYLFWFSTFLANFCNLHVSKVSKCISPIVIIIDYRYRESGFIIQEFVVIR